MRKSSVLLFLITLTLIVGIIGTIGIVNAAKGDDKADSFWVCVDKKGDMRLLTGKKEKCKKGEFAIELPSIQLISLLEEKIGELGDRIAELETPLSNFTITSTAGSGGAIDPLNTVTVAAGADQIFTITADTGYHITDVLVDGESVGVVSTYTFSAVTAGHTIAASFAIDGTVPEDLIITSTAGSGGTIDPLGTVTVAAGADQIFTITADTGYHITDVLVDGESVGVVSTYTFSAVTAGHTIAASFAIDDIVLEDLVLWLTMDEGQGSVVSDASGLGNDGVIHGASWATLNGAYALGFDGTGDKITLASPISVREGTLLFWIKSDVALGSVSVRKGLHGGGSIINYIWFNGNTIGVESATNGDDYVSDDISGHDWTIWHLLTIVRNPAGNGSKMYLDNAIEIGSSTNKFDATNTYIWNNIAYGKSRYWQGLFGECLLYNRALTPQEIQQNFQATEQKYQ